MSDKDDGVALAMMLVTASLIIFILGSAVGVEWGISRAHAEAIEHGAAYYKVNEKTGQVTFTWGQPPVLAPTPVPSK